MSYPIKVYHKTRQHLATVTDDTTFGELKGAMAQVSGVQPDEMKLYFRGKHFDGETMAEAGVKPGAKVLLVECENFRQRRASELEAEQEQAYQRAATTGKQQSLAQEEAQRRALALEAERVEREAKQDEVRRGLQAVAEVEREVDPLAREVDEMVASTSGGNVPDEQRSRILNELFTQKLLKLDSIQGGDEVRKNRKAQISRIEDLSKQLDNYGTTPRRGFYPRRTIMDVIKTLRPTVHQTWVPKTHMGDVLIGSVADTNATWYKCEYQGLTAAVLARGLLVEKCKLAQERCGTGERAAAHVRANTHNTRAIAAAAAEALAPIDNAPGRSMTMDEMQDLLDRLVKGKNQEGGPQ
ncbi:hypothetical protein KFL_007220030 [Klebsormidium nitens]|uniref:Ubiquitin-like domain-containing protein n=1 Tax=Klebsormidium nitens TaxID=105231 RepID=A0A1Y1IJU4_KLENI|nr:hypothetical protein KFL_007220030 [Klebsormidium nitens]|eukprot:GAQ91064.1 hypothetical protein KFL_007220030 [Klebsormidium nitens]